MASESVRSPLHCVRVHSFLKLYKIYADIYRPADTNGKKIPIIIPYSPYGKGGGGANLMDVVPYRVGVPKSRQSGLEKFEGLDFLYCI